MDDEFFGMIWGKSAEKAGGSMHLLLGHLLDTAAVGELVWDRFLASTIRDRLDDCSDGRGRSLFALLCGLHDVGKATPAFQMKDEGLAQRVRAAGLGWRGVTPQQGRQWHHARAGAVIVRKYLPQVGWSRPGCDWVWPLVAGHHGLIPDRGRLVHKPAVHGAGPWLDVQRAFVDRVAGDLNVDLASFSELRTPSRGGQLALSGMIIMADWVASDKEHFGGLSDLAEISMKGSRERAQRAWAQLGLRGGWRSDRPAPGNQSDLVHHRFGKPARPAQRAAVQAVREMPGPGLLILEAPMGEGKTEAALAAAEVLAGKVGADGVFVGMPTQATSDPMFSRVRGWLTAVDPEVPIGLLHGRARFNKEWAALRSQVRFVDVHDDLDEYGMADDFGTGTSGPGRRDAPLAGAAAAAEWFFGSKRGLLAAVTVGTVDHLLQAATRTKHVMLRHAGLAGRVVILDEVHAYDVYMAQFLFEALRWLADTGVPVIVLSATLPPVLRAQLAGAYLQGALQRPDVDLADLPRPTGYPSTTAVYMADGKPRFSVTSQSPWRESVPVAVEILAEPTDFAPVSIAAAVSAEVSEGGCALVVCNTVQRAQVVYAELRTTFGDDVVLLHSRFTAAERASRTEDVVDKLGPPGRENAQDRPARLVVVATQVAEQSFDVDVDILVTDLAPIDLLLQRVGRLHRHDRPTGQRPARLRDPKVIVSGLRLPDGAVPLWPAGSRAVYGDHLLLRSAALVAEAATGGGWSIPADVPGLVALGYGDEPLGPARWADAAAEARQEWEAKERRRRVNATGFLLSGEDGLGLTTLEGLHDKATAPLETEERLTAVVRDSDESVEVVLVRRGPAGYLTLAGRSLGHIGEVAVSDDAVLEEVVGATIRLPANKEITAAAHAELTPLAGWDGDSWLRRTRALILDDRMSAILGGRHLTYDNKLGLSLAPRPAADTRPAAGKG
ncbi:CRISPR-associated helicase, Cas3 family [Frankia casuarinae]|nr:CRISPR-associated helicase/endonuclease Cas3 [Frankia sp. CcI6]ETA02740.1 CRISPR-associated helicase, Cas3 family [Frankia sp. CcI6]EYT94187.1 CRISPR-associated helicase, Cas3 family [Frankia casuarinae]